MKRREETKIRYSAAEISQQPLDSIRHKVKGKTSTVINSTAPCILFKTVSSLTSPHRETSDLVPLRLQLDFSTNWREREREREIFASLLLRFLSATKRKGLNLDFLDSREDTFPSSSNIPPYCIHGVYMYVYIYVHSLYHSARNVVAEN